MLYNRHCKDRDDLQRRIQKLKDEGKDPSLPQRTDVAPPHHRGQHSANAGFSNAQNPIMSSGGSSSASHHQTYPRPMSDSHNTVDESFMVLGGQRSDPGDAFNQFWNALQGMLDNISQPVAFATAPLSDLDIPNDTTAQSGSGSQTPPQNPHVYGGIGLRRDNSASRLDSLTSRSNHDENYLSKWTKRMGIGRQGSAASTSSTVKDGFDDDEFDDEFLEEGDDLSGSFFLIPSGSEASPAALRKENASLKAELAATQERLKAAEHMLKLRKEQDMQLRNSIFEAQRVMSASGMLPRPNSDMSLLNFGKHPAVPIPSLKPNREAQYTKRIKELEEELRAMRAENEKNKLMIVKFRERWEKLKESAKRKKEAKASAESGNAHSNVRGQKIVEEPEAEEALDGTNG
ncbi:hypothetical protein CC1G_03836 [Coprinopsis cinerea okayama7|uniref:Uncharacterized protein n=1 Tax=Coprinopsis cinerea (strain Okayama-7 / 130 / ATCC MYA-4618 / FGSC 9003) TaxID=240176 RepID=A8NGW9_COPC7|nr:hypothetical protein CC1G_03836 [Coprinopsis cinerea okayama7\|eukprot:XP_001833619.2 hypothetical protein CC1G_03836 [Coprinopsis cinerea okayama7\